MKRVNLADFLNSNRSIVILLSVCVLLLNFNTLKNQYALDDEMVISKNMAVQQGFAGIPKILSTDAYQSFLDLSGSNSPLTGGRYRPLSIVSFAIEQQIFGKPYGNDYLLALSELQEIQLSGTNLNKMDMLRNQLLEADKNIVQNNLSIAPVRHAFQILYFLLAVIALWYLLNRYIFKEKQIIALIATLLFAFHPIHTEVIANLKSRDEIFSLLFILLTLIYIFRYNDKKTKWNIFGIVASFILALLSKEYALLLPVIAAIAMYLFRGKNLKDLRSDWFYLMGITVVAFLFFRYSIIGNSAAKTMSTDLLNNPYAFANPVQKIATKIYVCLEYIKLLIFPHPLSSDYSFSQIPYVGLGNIQVWFTVLFFASIGIFTIYLLKKRNQFAFPLLLFLLFFMLINNLLFEIGATVGERLIFHSSLGFCMLAAVGISSLAEKISIASHVSLALGITGLLLLPMGYKTIARNPDWKNNFTLFTKDVYSAPNSALTNGNAGGEYFNKGYFKIKNKKDLDHSDSILISNYADTALIYLNKAIEIYPRYANAYMNRGICYLYKGNIEQAGINWREASRLFRGVHPTLAVHSKVLLTKGLSLGYKKEYTQASKFLEYASELDPMNVEIWNNLAGAQFAQGNFKRAVEAFKKALELNPSLQQAQQGLISADNFLKLQNECDQNPNDTKMWLNNAKIFSDYGFGKTAFECYKHVLDIEPGSREAIKGVATTQGKENKK